MGSVLITALESPSRGGFWGIFSKSWWANFTVSTCDGEIGLLIVSDFFSFIDDKSAFSCSGGSFLVLFGFSESTFTLARVGNFSFCFILSFELLFSFCSGDTTGRSLFASSPVVSRISSSSSGLWDTGFFTFLADRFFLLEVLSTSGLPNGSVLSKTCESLSRDGSWGIFSNSWWNNCTVSSCGGEKDLLIVSDFFSLIAENSTTSGTSIFFLDLGFSPKSIFVSTFLVTGWSSSDIFIEGFSCCFLGFVSSWMSSFISTFLNRFLVFNCFLFSFSLSDSMLSRCFSISGNGSEAITTLVTCSALGSWGTFSNSWWTNWTVSIAALSILRFTCSVFFNFILAKAGVDSGLFFVVIFSKLSTLLSVLFSFVLLLKVEGNSSFFAVGIESLLLSSILCSCKSSSITGSFLIMVSTSASVFLSFVFFKARTEGSLPFLASTSSCFASFKAEDGSTDNVGCALDSTVLVNFWTRDSSSIICALSVMLGSSTVSSVFSNWISGFLCWSTFFVSLISPS